MFLSELKLKTDTQTVVIDGIFGKIQIKYFPRMKLVDVQNYGKNLEKFASLQDVLKENNCDVDGYAPECYIAIKSVLPEEDAKENDDFKIIPGYSAEGDTRLKALQNLYQSLAEQQAIQELSRLNN